jgi:hypothetical protein
MPKNRKVALRKKRERERAMVGGLCEYLNAAKATPGKNRVLGLLKAIKKHREERKSERRRHRFVLEVFDRFALYQRRVRVGLRINPRTDDWSTFWHVAGDRDEGAAVEAVLTLHDEKLDSKLRQCPRCGKWYFGITKYCTRKCWTSAYHSTEKYKKKMAAYARKYYREYGGYKPRED